MTSEEWAELDMLRQAISYNPATVAPKEQERFTQLLVRSWGYVNDGTLMPVEEVAQ